jgi:dCTP deaminase
MILSDITIRNIVKEHNLITNFVESSKTTDVKDVKYSFGLSSAGYDARLGDTFVVNGKTIKKANTFDLLPNQFILAHTIECFNMIGNVVGTCVGKSTLARLGVHVLVTPLEPAWSGQLTLEIKNLSNKSVPLYVGQGICQIQFHLLDGIPSVTYASKQGKYQNQTGVTQAIFG